MLEIKQYAYSALGYQSGITANDFGFINAKSKGQALMLVADHFLSNRGYKPSVVDVDQAPELIDRINEAINLAVRYGSIDGDHHKAWVIDGMIRALAGGEYDRIVAEACNGEDGPNTDEWDIGISP